MRVLVAVVAFALLAACEGVASGPPLPHEDGGENPGLDSGTSGEDAGGFDSGTPGVDAGTADAGPADSGTADAGPVDAGPPKLDVHFIGRFDVSNPAQPRSDWSGSGYVTRFKGTGIGISLEGSTNQFAVRVDNGTPTVLKFNGQATAMSLASGLADAEHDVEVYRRTEASFGPVRFKGFTVTGGALVPTVPPYTRKIEIIGDSISCGYGNEGIGPTCGFSADTENEFLAYGAITARALNAQHHTTAWSGRGMVRNYGGDMGPTMPDIYGRTLASDNNSAAWVPSRYVPDVIVIDLGTNDFSTGVNPGQPYADKYLQFVTMLRGLFPDAHIFCAIGPMDNNASMRAYVSGVVSMRMNAGDTKTHFVEFTPQGPLGFGCDYHPSLGTHDEMATKLTGEIRTALGW